MRPVVNQITSLSHNLKQSSGQLQSCPHNSVARAVVAVCVIVVLSMIPDHRLDAAQEVEQSQGGDAEAGKAKSTTCQACHGADGNGITPDYPNLAGQVPGHIAKQLASYKSDDPNSRNNAIMLGMVQALSEQDMADLDAYYSSMSATPGFIAEQDVEAAEKGGQIFRGGAKELQIPACMSCHGPAGGGVPPVYPRVAGQSAKYLEMQLMAFKNGERKHDIMGSIAFKLSAEQIRNVSLFMRGLN